MARFGVLRAAALWTLVNEFAMGLRRRFADDTIQLSYEELAESPEASVSKILRFIGVEDNAGELVNAVHDGPMEHVFSGNPMRLGRVGEIALDDAWRTELPLMKRLVTGALCGLTWMRLKSRQRNRGDQSGVSQC